MPTGVAIDDVRGRLFAAAERVLLHSGPSALTSRAVTTEAGCAKGVLHRHFTDFDAFLAELVLDRAARTAAQGAALRARAGSGTVVGNLAEALTDLFGPVAVAVVGLLISRDGLRARLRRDGAGGIPVLAKAAAAVAAYLAAERDLGRVAADADVATLAPTLIGAVHLLFADRNGPAPQPGAVRGAVAAVVSGAVVG